MPGDDDEIRDEYSREHLGAGVRGKCLEAYRKGTNLAFLAPKARSPGWPGLAEDDDSNECERNLRLNAHGAQIDGE